jgi:DNA polymerase (family X)
MTTPLNESAASIFDRIAVLLAAQGADVHRVRAYRRGAEALRALDRDAAELIHEGGERALVQVPAIGERLAAAIAEIARSGRLRLLDRLEGQVSPLDLFTSLPGIGDELARRIHDTLHIDTLEDLEVAAHDGRLGQVDGFGPRRVLGVQEQLAAVLSRSPRRPPHAAAEGAHEGAAAAPSSSIEPPVALLLDIDARYRRQARSGRLKHIAPRRFNPRRRAWLPVMHVDRDGFSFTAMFSNSPRAHHLGRSRDWVVIYFEHDGGEGQCTVVTEHRGPDEGMRVVRGREEACHRHHAATRREAAPEALRRALA